MAYSVQTPTQLFSQCQEYAKKFNTEKSYQWLTDRLVQDFIFQPFFIPDARLDAPSTTQDPLKLKVERLGYYGSRYRDLVQLLRNAGDSETRWFLLTAWLKQEKICQPKDFLPAEIYNKLSKDVRRKFKGLSPRYAHYCNLVEAWTPYFERLIKDFHAIKEENRKSRRAGIKARPIDPTETLIQAGHDPDAVRIVVNDRRRRAVPAAYFWLAPREHCDAFTIRNAHSLFLRALRDKGHNVTKLLEQFREDAGFITKT